MDTQYTCLHKSVVEDQVDTGLGRGFCALISFLSAGVGALQLDITVGSRDVLKKINQLTLNLGLARNQKYDITNEINLTFTSEYLCTGI